MYKTKKHTISIIKYSIEINQFIVEVGIIEEEEEEEQEQDKEQEEVRVTMIQ